MEEESKKIERRIVVDYFSLSTHIRAWDKLLHKVAAADVTVFLMPKI